MDSIQSRLTVYITAGTVALLLAAGVLIDRRISRQLEGEFDRALTAKAMSLVSLTEQDLEEVDFDLDEDLMPEFRRDERPEYFQLWLDDGTVLRRSSSLAGGDLPRGTGALNEAVLMDDALPDGREGRMVMFRFVPRIDEEDEDEAQPRTAGAGTEAAGPGRSGNLFTAEVVLARGRESLDELLFAMRTTLLATFLFLMAALALLTWLSIKRGLRPLTRMAADVRKLNAANLDQRIDTGPGSRELEPITHQLNDLLARLEDAFEREKRFSGNVAHELRTPIAELRALAEVGRGWPEEREMVEGFFTDLVDLADDMERTVVNLLMLARIDAGTQEVKQEPVKLDDLIDDTLERLATAISDKRIVVDNRLDSDVIVQSDRDKLKLIVVNILYNAVSYSPPGSRIVIDVQQSESGLGLSVSNEAAELSEQDLPLMFERFWRKDQSRSGDNHAGLGLSLVKSLAELLNLKLKPLLDAEKRFTLSLSGLMPA